jgi:ABC-2 type transport system ATP-binding protein
LRALLERLDRDGIAVERLTVHAPDLDDVFFALTGHPTTEPNPGVVPNSSAGPNPTVEEGSVR